MADKWDEKARALCDSLNLAPEHSPRRGETHLSICAAALRCAAAPMGELRKWLETEAARPGRGALECVIAKLDELSPPEKAEETRDG